MSINLSKGSTISLTKSSNDSLKKVFMGLGWDASDNDDIDLDASCIMFDSNKNVIDAVYFGQLKSKDKSIKHSGDNLTGDGDGDDEVIHVDLSVVPSNVQSLVFVINSYSGQGFNEIDNAYCRLVNADNNNELAIYKLSQRSKYSAQVMASVYRENGGWTMKAIGENANGSVWRDSVSDAKRFI